MRPNFKTPKSRLGLQTGMQMSPWIILGSTMILLIVVMVLTFQNTNRERRYMVESLTAKGAALIRAVEAGARTGMMGMRWGGRQIQLLLEETARLPDVIYMAVIDPEGIAVAHSDPEKIGQPFDPKRRIKHLGKGVTENWEVVSRGKDQRVFEVHRQFRPLEMPTGHMQGMMQRWGRESQEFDDWFTSRQQGQLLIVVGLDPTPLEEAIQGDIRTTVVLAVVLLLLGFGGFISLFWMHNYRVARRTLQDTSAFADEVVRHLPVGLIATDRLGNISFFNAAAERITGYDGAALVGRDPDSLLPEGLCGVQRSLDSGKTVSDMEMECRFSENLNVPVSVSATRIENEEGAFVGQVLILRDLSELRRLQDEVRRQEKLAAMGGLAAGVAHEVRNPLSSIKALATFFAGQFDEGSESREAARVMVQEVDRLNRVITELLDFSRPTDLNREAVPIEPLLSRSIHLVQRDASDKAIDIRLETEPDLCPVWIDPDRLTQCLLNLYLNAIQAMEGGGVLTVNCRSGGQGTIDVTVRDTGGGIPAEELNKIFDPYYTTKKRGTGLGLAIVHKIVEAHQGRVTAKSEIGAGSSFTLTLPCRTE